MKNRQPFVAFSQKKFFLFVFLAYDHSWFFGPGSNSCIREMEIMPFVFEVVLSA
jgi:hypothetical protein